jgi:hypothetical protein
MSGVGWVWGWADPPRCALDELGFNTVSGPWCDMVGPSIDCPTMCKFGIERSYPSVSPSLPHPLPELVQTSLSACYPIDR